jgi:predicted dehydrogenase
MSKLNVGIIGLGHAANSFHLPCLTQFSDVDLYLCDAWDEPLKKTAKNWNIPQEKTFNDIQTLLTKVDLQAVYLLIPQYALHHRSATPYEEYAIRCLKAGKPLFVEKPLGVDTAQARRITATAKECNVNTTMCGFQRRFNPLLRYALKRIYEKGQLLQCSFSFFKGMIRPDRSEESSHDNYDWLTLDLIHCLDLARWVPASEMISFHSTKRAYPHEQKVLSEFHSIATFKNGVTSFFSSNVRVGHRILRFELHGVGISIFITSEPNDGNVPECLGTSHHDMVATIFTSDGMNPYETLPKPEIIHAYQVAPEKTQQGMAGFYDQARHFIDCLKTGKATESSFEDVCLTEELCQRILEN